MFLNFEITHRDAYPGAAACRSGAPLITRNVLQSNMLIDLKHPLFWEYRKTGDYLLNRHFRTTKHNFTKKVWSFLIRQFKNSINDLSKYSTV